MGGSNENQNFASNSLCYVSKFLPLVLYTDNNSIDVWHEKFAHIGEHKIMQTSQF